MTYINGKKYVAMTGNRESVVYISTKISMPIELYMRCLAKEHLWAAHLTSLPKRGVITLSSVSTFNYERVPTSCLQRPDNLEANNWTNNSIPQNPKGTENSGNMSLWVWCEVVESDCISNIHLLKATLITFNEGYMKYHAQHLIEVVPPWVCCNSHAITR